MGGNPADHFHISNSKIALPKYQAWVICTIWNLKAMQGRISVCFGLYPFKRRRRPITEMFAGEGGPGFRHGTVHYVVRFAKNDFQRHGGMSFCTEWPSFPWAMEKLVMQEFLLLLLICAKLSWFRFGRCNDFSEAWPLMGLSQWCWAFMNAVSQRCRNLYQTKIMRKEVEEQSGRFAKRNGTPALSGSLPEGNNGLGLILLGGLLATRF
jgi:methylmalonyl-CoA mutase